MKLSDAADLRVGWLILRCDLNFIWIQSDIEQGEYKLGKDRTVSIIQDYMNSLHHQGY